MIDRAQLLRRGGVGAAALLPLLGAVESAAASEGAPFAKHPRWRFIFIAENTTDPLLVATQFGAQDACGLLGCAYRWLGSARGDVEEAARVLRETVKAKEAGIALARRDEPAFREGIAAARAAEIPVVGFGQDQRAAGRRAGQELARSAAGEVTVLAPGFLDRELTSRLEGVLIGARLLRRSVRVVRISEGKPGYADAIAKESARKGLHALLGLDGAATSVLGEQRERGVVPSSVRTAGFDLLTNEIEHVAEGRLDFVVDQQPYVQGFLPVVQLFLGRISEGIVVPADVAVTPLLLRKADVQVHLRTKSRFEGSTSRHAFPLGRA